MRGYNEKIFLKKNLRKSIINTALGMLFWTILVATGSINSEFSKTRQILLGYVVAVSANIFFYYVSIFVKFIFNKFKSS